MITKTVYLGSDHAGFELKEKVKKWLMKQGILHIDLGNTELDLKDDYPDFAKPVGQAVVKMRGLGILLCGSAEGMCIAANKIKGVRAVNPASPLLARLSREHNDANVLCLGGGNTLQPIPSLSFHKTIKIMELFLKTEFSKEPRHVRRLNKIKRLEKL